MRAMIWISKQIS